MYRVLKYLLIFYLLKCSPVYAEFSYNQRVHSFFDAHLLKEGEYLLDLIPFGSYYYGISENLEMGTSFVPFLFGLPNFFLKHNMFKTHKTETSFTSFTLGTPKKNLKEATFSGVASFHGIVTTYEVSNRFFLNAGLLHGYAQLEHSYKDAMYGDIHGTYKINTYGASLGGAYYLSKSWACNSTFFVPFYTDMLGETDLVDTSFTALGVPYFQGLTLAMGQISMTRSWDTFSFEFGLYRGFPVAITIPYISLIWRS